MTIVVVGIAVMMLMTLTALVIDHSFLRNDRRADQKVADAAAAAGAFVLDREDGRSACEAALTYLVENTPGVDAFDGADCEGDIPEFCDPATPAGVTVGTAGDYRIEIVHPIPDTNPLMARASALGAPTAPVVEADGSSCQRIGVAVELNRGPSFGTVLGAGEQRTRVHAVAKAGTPIPGLQPINLLILERYACHAVVVEGQAQLKLGAVVDGSRTFPGILAVDSAGYNEDGSLGANCGTTSSPTYGTLHLQGNNALVQADGPIGCLSELTPGTGDGCGYLELFAPGVPGPASPLYCQDKAYWPACTSTGIVRPHPVRMPERRTREPFDHRFNCQSGYGNKPWFGGHPIGACPEASISGVDADFVDELESYAHNNGGSAPTGFSTWSNCDINSSEPTVIPEGNVFVDCDVFRVKSKVTFAGGNVIFKGSVDVTSGTGDLTIHACGRETLDNCNPGTNALTWSGSLEDGRWTAAANYVESQYSNDAAWVYFRNGGIKKDAQAKVQIYDSAVFFRRSAAIPCSVSCNGSQPSHVMALSGGTGSLVWHAPREGPFDVLAMWSGSPLLHDMGGQSVLDMEGVYFAPVARLTYRGNGEQKQVAAQLVTERLTVTGGGTLIVRPNIHRAILDPEPYRSAIIR